MIELGFRLIENSTMMGFVGYGMATANGTNARLAALIGVIYYLAKVIIGKTHVTWRDDLYRFGISSKWLVADLIFTIACRALKLMGNQGLAIFTIFSFTRFAINTEYHIVPKRYW